jgi:hypothetical protein
MCGTRVRVEMSSGRSRRGGGGGGGGRRGSAPTRYSRYLQSLYHKRARKIFHGTYFLHKFMVVNDISLLSHVQF